LITLFFPILIYFWGKLESKYQPTPCLNALGSYFGTSFLYFTALIARYCPRFSCFSGGIGAIAQCISVFCLWKWEVDRIAFLNPSYIFVVFRYWRVLATQVILGKCCIYLAALTLQLWKVQPANTGNILPIFDCFFQPYTLIAETLILWFKRIPFFSRVHFLNGGLEPIFLLCSVLYWSYFWGLFFPYTLIPAYSDQNLSLLGRLKQYLMQPVPFKNLDERFIEMFASESIESTNLNSEILQLQEFVEAQQISSRKLLRSHPLFAHWPKTPDELLSRPPLFSEFGAPLQAEKPEILAQQFLGKSASPRVFAVGENIANNRSLMIYNMTQNFTTTPRVKWAVECDPNVTYVIKFEYQNELQSKNASSSVNRPIPHETQFLEENDEFASVLVDEEEFDEEEYEYEWVMVDENEPDESA